MDVGIAVFCALTIAAIASTRLAARVGVPALVLFVGLGVFAGSSGPLGIAFSDYNLAYDIGLIALAVILYSGGMETRLRLFNVAVVPAGMLATLGTVINMAVIGLAAWWLTPLDLLPSLLIGAVLCTTDAAAIFSSLKGRGLPSRLRGIAETEAGTNVPIALLMTLAISIAIATGEVDVPGLIVGVVIQLAIGAIAGVLLARALVWGINFMRLEAHGLYPILALTGGLLIYSVTNLLGGNGFLAAYAAGIVVGNARLAHRHSIAAFTEALAWGGQILMFMVLGLLVFPERLVPMLAVALGITAVVLFVARPLAVFGTLGLLGALSLGRFTFTVAERTLLSWAGLKGAVPIILAIIPLSFGIPGAESIFNIVFVVVLVGTLIQGFTLGPLAQRLGLAVAEPPRSPLRLELGGDAPIGATVTDVFLGADSRAVGMRIVDLDLPTDVVIAAVLRGGQLVTPRGGTVFEAGDHVYLISDRQDAPTPTAFLPRRPGQRAVASADGGGQGPTEEEPGEETGDGSVSQA